MACFVRLVRGEILPSRRNQPAAPGSRPCPVVSYIRSFGRVPPLRREKRGGGLAFSPKEHGHASGKGPR